MSVGGFKTKSLIGTTFGEGRGCFRSGQPRCGSPAALWSSMLRGVAAFVEIVELLDAHIGAAQRRRRRSRAQIAVPRPPGSRARAVTRARPLYAPGGDGLVLQIVSPNTRKPREESVHLVYPPPRSRPGSGRPRSRRSVHLAQAARNSAGGANG